MLRKIDSFVKEQLSSIRNREGRTLKDVLEKLDEGERAAIEQLVREELNRPPKIAIIGKTGVGKSSTINALLGTNLPVSHVEACTQIEQEVSFEGTLLNGKVGSIIVYDMPGLGEDLEADERHKHTYAQVIVQCDVAVWVLAAAGPARAMAYDQMMIRDVVAPANPDVVSRLVVGLNQVDVIQPGQWIEEANIPSETQKESIARRVADIREKLVKVCPRLTQDRIVPYSATRRYRLAQLFEAMLNACPTERAWVLDSRKSIADYRALVDPQILKLVESHQRSR